jgi:hypothetical protein
MLQAAAVWSLVAFCSMYVLWSLLLPAALRLRLINRGLQLPLPAALKQVLQRLSKKANACGCDGCDKSAVKPTPAAEQPVRIVRRSGR